ncbi:hypothetical protein BKA70DRAFT_1315466 [Coprinopsis sp. MPI-PUGE-AT-0042]|nr:hypothetical protein BKA70DRAFT_1315466 [Coprinopsis sp. MPI-PUGE-AT-0042]
MFKTLKSARLLRLLHPKKEDTFHGMLEASLPLELIYKIVDDHWHELIQDNGRNLRALAHTCRAFAAYCRPYLFHSITLYSLDATIPATPWLGPITRPARFSQLVRAYPSSAELVKELRIIVIKPYWPKEERALKKFGIDAQRSGMMPWRSLLKASYPALTTLRVRVTWTYVSPIFSKSFLKALKAMESLETLVLYGGNLPLHQIIQCIPTTLKHFSILGGRRFFVPPPIWTPPPHPACTLESLTLTAYYWSSAWISSITSVDSSPFNLEALSHLQTRACGESSPGLSRMCSTPSNTLRCLHLSINRFDYDRGFERPFRLGELRALTHLEIVMECAEREWQVFVALDWLERSLKTFGDLSGEVRQRLSCLTTCIVFHVQCNFEDQRLHQHRQHLALWESVFDTPKWSYLGLTNVVGYSTAAFRPHMVFFGFHLEVANPQPLGQSNISSYEQLWGNCVCAGWECW